MDKGFFEVPFAGNEPVLSYRPGSAERIELKAMLERLRGQLCDLPMIIGGNEVRTGKKERIDRKSVV